MSRLRPFLKNLDQDPVAAADALMSHVYGFHASSTWQPAPLADNKSRYLWTDAFGVVNYISLYKQTNEKRYLDQAAALISSVHNILGRQRPGGAHAARLNGATDQHPTLGGLRIGKIHEEGHPDGDGQYFHYLTKWAFALNRMAVVTGDVQYNTWAAELMASAHPHFVHTTEQQQKHIYWKMSIDLTRPAVPSEGNLDPFDGLVTVKIIRALDPTVLAQEEEDFRGMVNHKVRRYQASDDPLDLGEALWLAHWGWDGGDDGDDVAHPQDVAWSKCIAKQSLKTLKMLWENSYFEASSGYRLAFREFGTTLGVQMLKDDNGGGGEEDVWIGQIREWKRQRVPRLHSYWAGHVLDRDQDITPVMMASSLLAGGAWKNGFL